MQDQRDRERTVVPGLVQHTTSQNREEQGQCPFQRTTPSELARLVMRLADRMDWIT
jgi:hypothetical protein